MEEILERSYRSTYLFKEYCYGVPNYPTLDVKKADQDKQSSHETIRNSKMISSIKFLAMELVKSQPSSITFSDSQPLKLQHLSGTASR